MPGNKYELRSDDVQKIMNKPPHALVSWGNTLVLVITIAGLWLLSLVHFPDKISVPFQVARSGNIFLLVTNEPLPAKVKKGQPVKIHFESYPTKQFGSVKLVIDSMFVFSNKPAIKANGFDSLMLTDTRKKIFIKNEQQGSMEIITGERNILDFFKIHL